MAQSKDPAPADVQRESAQPKTGAQKPAPEVASPDIRRAAAEGSARADADVVAMVSRDVNGDPAQSVNYEVLVDDDAPDEVKDAAHNKAGEALGAKFVEPVQVEDAEDPERAKTESAELRQINRGAAGDDKA